MTFNTYEYFDNLSSIMRELNFEQIDNAVELILNTVHNNNKILTCGNGGSAYAASHFITDWNKMYTLSTKQNFRGISLCDNIGLVTAYGNDISYDDIFSGQLSSLGDKGDLLVVVSGSGNSQNVVNALNTANEIEMSTLAIVGYDGGICSQISQNVIHIPSFDMQFCEDIHVMIGHIIMKKLCNFNLVI